MPVRPETWVHIRPDTYMPITCVPMTAIRPHIPQFDRAIDCSQNVCGLIGTLVPFFDDFVIIGFMAFTWPSSESDGDKLTSKFKFSFILFLWNFQHSTMIRCGLRWIRWDDSDTLNSSAKSELMPTLSPSLHTCTYPLELSRLFIALYFTRANWILCNYSTR